MIAIFTLLFLDANVALPTDVLPQQSRPGQTQQATPPWPEHVPDRLFEQLHNPSLHLAVGGGAPLPTSQRFGAVTPLHEPVAGGAGGRVVGGGAGAAVVVVVLVVVVVVLVVGASVVGGVLAVGVRESPPPQAAASRTRPKTGLSRMPHLLEWGQVATRTYTLSVKGVKAFLPGHRAA